MSDPTTPRPPDDDEGEQEDGSHMAPPVFQELTGRAQLNDDGTWVYVPGPGEGGYDPAQWGSPPG